VHLASLVPSLQFDANKNTLLGQMFALKPGTDKMLKAEHEEEARHRN